MACAKIKKQLCFYLGRKPLSSYKMGDELSYWGKERKREHRSSIGLRSEEDKGANQVGV